MKNRFGRKLNNKGVSLLLVIMTMTVVSVLAAIILALTYRNLKNMQDSIQSANSFYSAENAMDEMRAKFYEWSDQSLRVSYEKWVQSYNTIPADMKEIVYKQKFVAELENKLNDEFINKYFGAAPQDISSLFATFASDRVSWNTGVIPSLVKLEDDTKMKVKNVSLRYVDKAGYETIITTDIDLEVRYAGFSTNVIESSNENCAYYSVITDSQIVAAGGTSSMVTIDGNIYAGGYDYSTSDYTKPGIVFNQGSLNIYADKIISKNNIEFSNGAKLVAKGPDARYDYTGELSLCNIWAAGLNMNGDDGSPSMNIQGNCFIFDDTTLDANGSEFNVVGSYYGYNTTNAADKLVDENNISLNMGTPKGSSCIVVNGSNTKVDLRQCDPLWIAGKSFVSVPKNYGAPVSDANISFPQGESISFRATQSAYLIPGDCIAGVGHNPMTEAEYLKLKDDDDTSVFFDIDRSRRNGGVNLTTYLDIDNPYRVATVDYGSGSSTSKLVYLYANFISTEHATEYFREYNGKHDDLVNSKVSMIGNGNILFNPLALVTTGNVISYDSSNKTTVYENTDAVVDERIETKEAELNEKYNGLITALDEDYTGVGVSRFLSECFVDFSKVADEYKDQLLNNNIGLNGQPYHLITGNDVVVESNVNAIVLAKGTVTIKNGAKLNGLIVAHDNVIIENGSGTFVAEPDEVSDLMLYNEKVAPYFMLDAEGGSGDDEDGTYSSDLFIINYDNWKKN